MCSKCDNKDMSELLIPEGMKARCPVCDHFVDNPEDLAEGDVPDKEGWKVFGHKSCFDACGEDLKPKVVN